MVKDWLTEHCPPWKDMLICNAAKYLGIYLGPLASPLQWPKALGKFQDRIGCIHSAQLPAQLARRQYISKAAPTLGYIAQLVKPPPNINRIGMNSVMKVLRLAGNSLSYNTAFSLDLLGAPSFPDLIVYLKSCMIRTACKTVSGYGVHHKALLECACEHLPFNSHKCKSAIPPGWDSPAFCSTLVEAALLLPHDLSNSQRDGRVPVSSSSGPLQAKVFKQMSLGDAARRLAWRKLLGDRLCILCPDEYDDPFVISEECLNGLIIVLLTLKPGPRLCVIKTLINSWATSSRMHESVILPCACCGEFMEDELTHYLSCDSFWTLLVSSARLNKSFLSLTPSQRLGLSNPSTVGFNLLAGAFLVYHAVKLGHTETFLQASASGDFSPVQELIIRLAVLHYRDIFQLQ